MPSGRRLAGRHPAGPRHLEPPQSNPGLALELFEALAPRTAERGPDRRWELVQGIGLAQLALRRSEEAVGTWKEAIVISEATSEPADNEMRSRYNLACAYSLLGRLDEAFEALVQAYASGPPEAVAELKTDAKEDADLANLRRDPRWKDLYGGE